MSSGISVKMRGAKVEYIRVGPTWTFIKIKVRTDSIAAQGTRKIFGAKQGRPLRRKIRAKAREAASLV